MNRTPFYLLVALGVAWRLWMLTNYSLVSGGEVDVYLADEGIVGLMGKHILEGRELPVFFYGQSYLGALEAYCVAASFALFGTGPFALHLVPFLFSLALGVAVYHYAYRFHSVAVARWATALVAVAPMYFLQWNLKARGGFVEHVFLLFVLMILFGGFHLYARRDALRAFSLGLVGGLAVWVNQLVAAYLGVMGVLLWWSRDDRRGWKPLLVGFALGSSLLVVYNVVHPLATARSLARKALVMNRVDVEERDENWARKGLAARVAALGDGLDKLGIVFGVPPGEGVAHLGMSEESRAGGPLRTARRALFVLPLAVFGAGLWASRPRRGPGGWNPMGSAQLLGLFVLITFVVGYVSSRYMLPAYPIAAVLAGVLLARLDGLRRHCMTAGLVALLVFHVASWVDEVATARPSREGYGTALVDWLVENRIGACYSAAPLYHLVFASGEKVVIAPLQKNRYPPYDAVVGAAESICYVHRDDQVNKRQHLALMALLESRGVRWREDRVGPYTVLHGFEPRAAIRPADIEAVRRLEVGAGAATSAPDGAAGGASRVAGDGVER